MNAEPQRNGGDARVSRGSYLLVALAAVIGFIIVLTLTVLGISAAIGVGGAA
jgi:hypothetical protein